MGLLRGPDGQIVNLPDEQVGSAIASGYEPVSLGAAAGTTTAQPTEGNGLAGAVGAGASSFLSGATLGASDLALKHVLSPAGYKQLAADREDHPWISGAGQLVGAVAPSLLSGGTLTPSGDLSSVTQQATEGGLGQSLIAAGFEWATQNVGAYVADAALGDRDASAEGMVGAVGRGFAFGAGGAGAAHGVEAGTIAARRLFARVMDGGPEAAQAAEQAWKSTSQEVLEAHDQAAEIAKAKLAAARTAREQAAIARDQASAGLAEAKLAAPDLDSARAPAVALDEAIGKVGAQEAVDASGASARVPEDLAAFARQASVHPTPTASDIESLHDLAQKVDAYTAARRELDEMMARVEPDHDLEDAMGRFEAPGQVQTADGDAEGGVPRGEFGEPGKGGFKTQGELGRLAAERGDGMAEGTPALADRTVGSRPSNAAKATGDLDLDMSPISELSAARDRINADIHAYYSANGYAPLPDDLRSRAEYAEQIDRAITDRHHEDWAFQKELLPYDELVKFSDRLHADWLRASHDGSAEDQVRLLEKSYDQIKKVVDRRRELNASTPGEVIAVTRLGVGSRDGISLNVVSGKTGKYRSGDGSTWSSVMEGERGVSNPNVVTSGHHAMFNALTENRMARALDGSIAEIRVGYIDGIPHLFQREVTQAASEATNPLIGAWAKDTLAARLGSHDHDGPGPAVREVLASASASEAKRYISGLSDAYSNNRDALYRVIDDSGLSEHARARVKARAQAQITWLIGGGGAVAAPTAGAAVAQASVSSGDEQVTKPGRLTRRSVGLDGDTGPAPAEPTGLGRIADGTGPVSRLIESSPKFEGSDQVISPSVSRDEFRLPNPEPQTELEKLLQGTKERIDLGEPLGKIASESPARESYVLDKAATRAPQADEVRAAARARRLMPAAEPETDLERALRGTKEGLDSGKSMRDLRMAKGTGEHPLAVQQLEMAHD